MSRPSSPPPSTARPSTRSSSAPACCSSSAGRADARRAVDHALSLEPKNDRTWLTLAGYQRYCWNDPGWRKSLDRARELSGHDTVFAGTDAEVVAASDACTTG